MALPFVIQNGDYPDATKLEANFQYLYFLGLGQQIKQDTFANLRAIAALAPMVPFFCIASAPDNMLMLYCGDVTAADGGFVTLASWVPGGIS